MWSRKGCLWLEINDGRYLAVNDGGDYCISTFPQAIRARPIPVRKNKGLRYFRIDGDDHYDVVAVGTLGERDTFVVVAGDKIRDDLMEEEEGGEKEVVTLPPLVYRYPHKMPENTSLDQLKAEVSQQVFAKVKAHLVKGRYIEDDDPQFLYLSSSPDNISILESRFEVRSIDCGDHHLEITDSRYLSVNEGGRYCISPTPEAIRANSIRVWRKEGLCYFQIDHGHEYFDVVAVGTLGETVAVGKLGKTDRLLLVAGEKIQDWSVKQLEEDEKEEEEKGKKIVVLLPVLAYRYPHKRPGNIQPDILKGVVSTCVWDKVKAHVIKAGYYGYIRDGYAGNVEDEYYDSDYDPDYDFRNDSDDDNIDFDKYNDYKYVPDESIWTMEKVTSWVMQKLTSSLTTAIEVQRIL